jgi:hypothetical protein
MKQTIQCLLLVAGIAQLQPAICEANQKKRQTIFEMASRNLAPKEVSKRVAEHL